MCDYSLEAYRSRPAVVGEKLTLGRFATGSMGFVSGTVCDTAVCIPAESKLLLQGVGEGTQKVHGVGAVEEAVLTRLKRGHYKDAVRFSNGAVVVLQQLDRGLTALVMTYGPELDEPSRGEAAVGREHELALAEMATRDSSLKQQLMRLARSCWHGVASVVTGTSPIRTGTNVPAAPARACPSPATS